MGASPTAHPSASGATQAGLVIGAASCLPDTCVVGIDIDAQRLRQLSPTAALAVQQFRSELFQPDNQFGALRGILLTIVALWFFYFLVKEPHCKGHEEKKEQSVAEFRASEGVAEYDEINRGWIHLLMKLASWKTLGGPWGQEPDERTKKMFFMATTDIDAFRMFVFNSSFLDKYDIAPEMREELAMNDEALQKLAFDWLHNLMFNEPTIGLREHVLHDAIAKARGGLGGT